MIRYGERKRGSSKIHSHEKCFICSEKNISKKTERFEANKAIEEEIIQYLGSEKSVTSCNGNTIDC